MPRPPPAAGYDPPKVVAGVPILAISGEADPGDPPDLLAGLARHYPDSRLLVAVNQGHWFVPDRACFTVTVAQFVASASVDAVTPDCLGAVAAPRFSVG